MSRQLKISPSERETLKSIGKRLATRRKALGITQVELAKKIDVAQPHLSAFENGRLRVYGSLLIKFCQALKISADELLGIEASAYVETQPMQERPKRKFMKRIEKIEQLPDLKQKEVLRMIDLVITGLGESTKKDLH